MAECIVVFIATVIDALMIHAQEFYAKVWRKRCQCMRKQQKRECSDSNELEAAIAFYKVDVVIFFLLLGTNVGINAWFLSIW